MTRARSQLARLALAAASLAAVLGAGVTAPGVARASKPRCRLERIDTSRLGDGKLTVYASALELEGDFIGGLHPQDFTLLLNNKREGKAEKVVPFSAAKEPVYVALVVEVAAQYKPALENVKTALKDFLEEQPASMKVRLYTFGSETETQTSFIVAPSMTQPVDDLSPEDDSVEVQMTGAVERALNDLRKQGPPPDKDGNVPEGVTAPRRVIVLVSDGLNARMDKATFRHLGEAAAKAGVPIHSIAYSPIDSRGPLLNLGELSKRSFGTFRWAQKAEDLKQQLDTLADEVRRQYVVTFPSKVSTLEKRRIAVMCRDMRSNDYGATPPPPPKGRGIWYWVGVSAGSLVGLLGLLFVLGVVLKAREARAGGAPVGGTAGVAPAAGRAQPVAPARAPTGGRAAVMPAAGGIAGGAAAVGAIAGAARTATLIAVSGGLAGNRFPIRSSVVIGKAPGLIVCIADDPTVSTQHCEIRPQGGGFLVVDLQSTNGTFVNGRRVSGAAPLGDGDILRIGEGTQFKFRVD